MIPRELRPQRTRKGRIQSCLHPVAVISRLGYDGGRCRVRCLRRPADALLCGDTTHGPLSTGTELHIAGRIPSSQTIEEPFVAANDVDIAVDELTMPKS